MACSFAPKDNALGRTRCVMETTIASIGWTKRNVVRICTCQPVLVVIIELSGNSVFQLYCPKDYYKQKQWNTLPVTMITEIMNFNRLLWWLPWQ